MERFLPAKIHGWLGWVTLALMLTSIYAIFMYAPLEKIMREVQKIFYIHVGTAWNAFFAFFIVLVASILYLSSREKRWDRMAAAAAELGILFTTIVLITGPIWARSSWNTWWNWEPRLTTTLVLWFIYVAYLLIRRAMTDERKRAVTAAAFGIIGFIDVPIVYLSIRWWSVQHPVVFGSQGGGLHPAMLQALIITVFAFTALFFYLLQKIMAVSAVQDEVDHLKEALRARYD